LRLKNPLVAAAGPITANVEMVERLVDAGVAAIVTKTGFVRDEYERWIGRKSFFPYKPVYKYQALRGGRLLALPALAELPVEEMAARISEMKRLGVPVIGSVMGLSVDGYSRSARVLVEAGADAIEIDLCCTIPEFTTLYPLAGQNVNFTPKNYARIVAAVKRAVRVPVGVKSTVSLYIYGKVLEGLIRAKIKNVLPDFVTLVGQLDQNPGVDLERLAPIIPHVPTFGWQGSLAPLTYSAVATFSSIFGVERPQFSASGGIHDHASVVTALALGATTVQLQSAVLDKGVEVVSQILRSLENYMGAHGLASLASIVGKASGDYIPATLLGRFMRERDGLFGRMVAAARREACNGCGLCARVCTEDAIVMENGKPLIDKARCRACNLCVLKCAQGALYLENHHLLDELAARFKNGPEIRSFRQFMAKQQIGWRDLVQLPKNLRRWGLRA
jgi:dihydropyrimidine dehydrogenase (NAD+) subunit PreA